MIIQLIIKYFAKLINLNCKNSQFCFLYVYRLQDKAFDIHTNLPDKELLSYLEFMSNKIRLRNGLMN